MVTSTEGIKRLGHTYIFVELNDLRPDESGRNWKRNLRRLTEDLLARCLRSLRNQEKLPAKPLSDWSEHMADIVNENCGVKWSLGDMLRSQDELISRSLNVCFLSVLTAKAMGFREHELREVAVGSLLHDIGLAVPLEDRLALHHPLIGYDLLRKYPAIPQNALQIVLQHHERIDGRGFPLGTKGSAVRKASQICGACSEFDDFMNRSLTKRLPCEGFDFMMSKIDTSYDFDLVRAFLGIYEPYPVGTAVTMTDNLEGVVSETNPGHPCRPVVKLKPSGERFDLMRHTTCRIERAELAMND